VEAGEALKRLKIEASMAQVALKKAEKQLAQHDTEELRQQVETLRAAAEQAQQALAAAQPATPAPAAAKPASDEALKKAKIEAAMLRAQIRKLEKLEAPDDDQQAELAHLRQQLEEADKLLAAAEAAAPAPAAKPAGDEALKKAKIEAAMLRAQIRKLEKLEAPDDDQQAELARLRQQLEEADQALASAEAAAPAPVPAAKPVDEALKKAKIELAMARAELKKAEKAGADEAELTRLRKALANAEQALHAAEDSTAKPAPDLVRVEKRPVDDATRQLKTELAFARAELRKLERTENPEPAALDAARAKLAEAERKLAENTAE
jgi:electron transport complex protein RnfC